mmetsp:Transcript_13418/g.25250  ORF Transcript_13418/g.25250 Transcript_13418/m.25250 type:complete len:295 (-) Transcript_13418:294-1178(-)
MPEGKEDEGCENEVSEMPEDNEDEVNVDEGNEEGKEDEGSEDKELRGRHLREWAEEEMAYYFRRLPPCEISEIHSEIERKLSPLVDSFQEEILNGEQLEILQEHFRQISTDIRAKAKAFRQSNNTISEDIDLHYLDRENDQLCRVRSGEFESVKTLDEVHTGFNWDNSIYYYNEEHSQDVLAIDLLRNYSKTRAARIPFMIKAQIAVSEGFINAIAPLTPMRYNLASGVWEDIPKPPARLTKFRLVLKKEARKLYVLSNYSGYYFVELSTNEMRWRVIALPRLLMMLIGALITH